MPELPEGPSSSDLRESVEVAEPAGSASSFGLYKYGRGYWVRVMTAVGLGVLFLAGAGWAWQQLSALSLPKKAWNMPVVAITGTTPSVGSTVTLERVLDGKAEAIGTGVVEVAQTQAGTSALLRLKNIAMNDAALTPRDAGRISSTDFSANTTANGALGVPIIEPVYLQGTAAILLLLIGCAVIYYYVGRKTSSVDFLIATDEEMRKVNWSTRKIIIDSTQVVVLATFLIAGYIFVMDLVMKAAIFEQIVR